MRVIFVKEFEDFIKETGFTIYLCKKHDPVTKGKIKKQWIIVKLASVSDGESIMD